MNLTNKKGNFSGTPEVMATIERELGPKGEQVLSYLLDQNLEIGSIVMGCIIEKTYLGSITGKCPQLVEIKGIYPIDEN